MSDIHALSGAYAVDALDDLERAQFERHVAACPECRAEVSSFRETMALLAESETQSPPPSLRAGVVDAISQVRPLPPEASARPATTPASRRRLSQLLVAAAAVVLLVGGAVAWHPWRTQHTDIATEVLHARDAEPTTQRLPGGHGSLTLVSSPSLDRAVLVARGVPEPKQGTTYELWLQRPSGHLVPAGLMPDTTQPTLLTGHLGAATAAAVSVEPAGGSQQPTTKPIALFSFIRSTSTSSSRSGTGGG